jgi:uncharacterized protein (DUF2147 family)
MKKLLLLPFLFFYSMVFAQNSEDVTGVWLNQSAEGKIKIFKVNDLLFGNLIWLKNPNNENGKPKLDNKNPDATKANRKLQGLLILTGFHWDQANKHWNDGEIYDPKSGKTYKCSLTLQNKDELHIRGYIGISLLGRTDTWTRVKEE